MVSFAFDGPARLIMKPSTTHHIQILLAALLFSTGGAAIKACSLTSWQVASFRSGIATITLLLIVPNAQPDTESTGRGGRYGLRQYDDSLCDRQQADHRRQHHLPPGNRATLHPSPEPMAP